MKDVRDKSGSNQVCFMKLDLESFESIREFSRQFHEAEKKLDVLINNAGLLADKKVTKDGLEKNVGVNHIGHFLLTHLLLDMLKYAAPSRVVIVSSGIHQAAVIQKDEFERNKTFNQWKAFSHSKLANLLFMRELSKRLVGTGVTANALCPGAVSTEAIDKFNILVRMIMYPIKKIFFKSVEIGAETYVMLAVEPELETVTGKYFKVCVDTEPAQSARDDEIASWLWEQSEKLTGY